MESDLVIRLSEIELFAPFLVGVDHGLDGFFERRFLFSLVVTDGSHLSVGPRMKLYHVSVYNATRLLPCLDV